MYWHALKQRHKQYKEFYFFKDFFSQKDTTKFQIKRQVTNKNQFDMIPGSNQELMIFKIQSLNSSITFDPPSKSLEQKKNQKQKNIIKNWVNIKNLHIFITFFKGYNRITDKFRDNPLKYRDCK